MARRQDRDAAHAVTPDLNLAFVDRQLGDADVEALGRQELAHHVGMARDQPHRHAGTLAEELRHEVGQEGNGGRGMAGDRQPTRLALANLRRRGLQPVDLAQHATCFRIEQHALGRRLQPAVGALEQGEANRLLQTRDLGADRGLGHTHGARGGGHGAVIDHRPEGFEELDVHTL